MKKSSERIVSLTGRGRRAKPAGEPIIDHLSPEVIAPELREMVLGNLEAARNGDLASEAEVQALLKRYRL